MEVARVEYCRALGFHYKEMEADGILLAVAESHCRYVSSAKFDDKLHSDQRLGHQPAFFTFDYEMSIGNRALRLARPVMCPGPRSAAGTAARRYAALFGID